MPHVSASQIGTWLRCERWWAYTRVHGEPANRYTDFGNQGHGTAESWLLHGTPPSAETPVGRTILAGLHLLPPPGSALVEHSFRMQWETVEYVGRIDFMYGYTPGESVVIGDHKTTGNFQYAKTPDTLLTDPQGVIYSAWAAMALDAQWVTSHWVYYMRALGRAQPEARAVITAAPRDEILDRFAEQHRRVVLSMMRAYNEPLDARPRTPSACRSMGGCPHQERCWNSVSPSHRAAAALGAA